MENAARGTVDVKLEEHAAVRETVAMRRKVISVRKDILVVFFGLLCGSVTVLGDCLTGLPEDEVGVVKVLMIRVRLRDLLGWKASIRRKDSEGSG